MKNPSNLYASLLALTVVALAACQRFPTSVSQPQHAVGHPVNYQDGWNWAEETEDDFMVRSTGGTIQAARDSYLPANDPLRQRLNFWADRIYDALAAAHPEDMANVPRPKVLVRKSAQINAFVSPVPVCYTNVRGVFSGSAPTKNVLLFDGAFMLSAATNHCVERPATRAELEQRLHTNFGQGDCQVALEENAGQFVIRPAPSCLMSSALAKIGSSERIVVFSTSPWVTFYSSLLKQFSERQVVATLAHELGHYFRSHITMRHRYNYAYKLHFDRAPTVPGRADPTADDAMTTELRSIELGVHALQNAQTQRSAEFFSLLSGDVSGIYAPIMGQKYHSALIPFLANAAVMASTYHCSGTVPAQCNADCTAAAISGAAYKDKQKLIATATGADRDAYLAFEAAASACFAATPLAPGDAAVSGPLGLATSELVKLIDSGVKAYVREMPKATTLSSYLQGLNQQVSANYPAYNADHVAEFLGRGDAMQKATVAMKGLKVSMDEMTGLVNRDRIGLYSQEQEADELSGEFLSMIGVDPHAAVDLTLGFSQLAGEKESSTGERCDVLYKAGWQRGGQSLLIPIGSLEYHHQNCFRAFDIDREIAAHQYDKSYTYNASMLDPAAWQGMVGAIKASSALNESWLVLERQAAALPPVDCRFAPEFAPWSLTDAE